MQFNIHQLTDELSPYIESIFHLKGFQPDHSIERVVPTGHSFLIFELDGITRNTFHNDSLEPQNTYQDVWLSGIHRSYLSISAHHDSEMLVVQFKPIGGLPFVHHSMNELSEQVIPGVEVFGQSIITLRDQLLGDEESNEKFARIESWLLSRFDHAHVPPKELVEVANELSRTSGASYSEVVEGYRNSQKQLIDQFKKYVGLTPKYFQRILRFNEILKAIREKQSISWAEIAYQSGFSDQSHFIKEFKHFSGFNPQEFINEEHNQSEPNFFPLDRKG